MKPSLAPSGDAVTPSGAGSTYDASPSICQPSATAVSMNAGQLVRPGSPAADSSLSTLLPSFHSIVHDVVPSLTTSLVSGHARSPTRIARSPSAHAPSASTHARLTSVLTRHALASTSNTS